MSNEIIKTAKPTEYKGVIFRSKSEAMFAYCLDKFGLSYEYEPIIDGIKWVPDFLIEITPFKCILLEYKPSIVTDTYSKWVCEQMTKACEILQTSSDYSINWKSKYKLGSIHGAILLDFDFWNPKGWCYGPVVGIGFFESEILFQHVFSKMLNTFGREALHYRFDLQHSNSNIDFETKEDPLAKSDSQIQYEKRIKLGIPEREFWFINLLIKYNNQIDWVIHVFESSWMTHPVTLSVAERVIQAHRNGSWQGGGALLNDVEDAEMEELIAMVLVDCREIPNIEKQLPDVLTYLRNQRLIQQIRELNRQMDDPDCDPDQLVEIMQQRQDFEKMRKNPIENPNMQP